MVVRDAETGELKVALTREEFRGLYKRWQDKPETKAMFGRIAAERRASVVKILAEIEARKR